MNKLTTDFRADKKNPVLVHVWNIDEEKAEYKHRIALEVFTNNKIRCVADNYNNKYLNNEFYETCTWDNHETNLLPEKKQVPYTVEELHDLGAREIKRPSGRYHIINDTHRLTTSDGRVFVSEPDKEMYEVVKYELSEYACETECLKISSGTFIGSAACQDYCKYNLKTDKENNTVHCTACNEGIV